MAANPYDQWLEAAKADGEMPYEMYAEYLSFWKSEFFYTLQSAALLFDDADEYRSWRASMEEWLDASAEALQLEMTQMGSQASKLEVIIPHCESVRQKTMDAKKFCYVMETQESPSEPETLTSFAWRWTLDELDTAKEAIKAEEAYYELLRSPKADTRWENARIMLVDLDGEGIEECLVDGDLQTIDILHYRNGQVREYSLGF